MFNKGPGARWWRKAVGYWMRILLSWYYLLLFCYHSAGSTSALTLRLTAVTDKCHLQAVIDFLQWERQTPRGKADWEWGCEGHTVNLFTSRPWPRLITVLWDLTSDQLRAPTPTQPLVWSGINERWPPPPTGSIGEKLILVNYFNVMPALSSRAILSWSHSIVFWLLSMKVVFCLYLNTFWNFPVFFIPLACFKRRSSSSFRGLYFISDMSWVPHFQSSRAKLP